MSWSTLGKDAISVIFTHLEFRDLLAVRIVSKRSKLQSEKEEERRLESIKTNGFVSTLEWWYLGRKCPGAYSKLPITHETPSNTECGKYAEIVRMGTRKGLCKQCYFTYVKNTRERSHNSRQGWMSGCLDNRGFTYD